MKVLILPLLLLCTHVGWANDSIQARIQRNSVDDTWTVTYQLPKATTEVYFYRQGRLPRDQWRFTDPNLALKKDKDGWQTVFAKNGRTFDGFSVQFASDYRKTPKDYELNFRFTDGSVILYTGHLALAMDPDAKNPHQFQVQPETGAHVIESGTVYHKQHNWLDEGLQGSYVYFGNIEPVQSERMLAILDPGLPNWVLQRLNQDLPKLFDYYTEKTGLTLDFTPVIYFSFKPDEAPGTQYSGGTLPGLIQFSLRGNDWQQQTPNNLIGILHFLAHEAAHLWNSQLIQNASGNDGSWIHEGSADAFAVRALEHLGVFDAKDVVQEHENYLNQCIDLLEGHAMIPYGGHKNFSVYYNCGSTIAWLTERALQQKKKNADLYDFWAPMMQRMQKLDQLLSIRQYIKSLAEIIGDSSLIGHLVTLLEEPQSDPIAFFTQVFADVGMALKPIDKHPRMRRTAAEKGFAHLMIADCEGRISYHRRGSYYEVGDGLTCKTLKTGMKVYHIAGFTTAEQGHDIHASVTQHCAQGKTINLSTVDGEEISLMCEKALPPLRPWLSVQKT